MTAASAPAPLPGSSPYAKMNGIGNSILVVDRRGQVPLATDDARRLHGRPGLAFDQLMELRDPQRPGTDAFVDIFNADGSRAGACGNGTRCVAWFLLHDTGRREATVETSAGLLACTMDGPLSFTVDMGRPRFGWHDIPLRDAVEDTRALRLEPHAEWMDPLGPCTALSMGNPHAVFFLRPDVPLPDLRRLGPALEHHPLFPERANISFARALSPDRVRLDVWERGAGLTLACGSAACATLVAGVRTGRLARQAVLTLPGGDLAVAWREADSHVLMSGAVALEHAGTLSVDA